MKPNERLQAIRILSQLLKENTPLSHLLHDNLTPLVKEICFGVCRYYFQLQSLANKLLKSRPKAMEIWVSILIGLYQLRFLNIPDYAVVQETVATLEKLRKIWAKGLVNAVLRNYCRSRESLEKELNANPSFAHNHPQWFIKKLQKDWPNDWEAILKANDSHPPMSLRVNRQKTTAAIYLKQLETAGMSASLHSLSPTGLVLKKPCAVNDLPGFSEGLVSVQDIAAQLAAPLLDLKPGLRVLDACCAPGGKTCHIKESEPELKSLIALDIEKKRIYRVLENLKRLQLSATVIQGDALVPDTWWNGELFDRILLDAPCSATGVIRRNPDIKLLRKPEEVTAVAARQHALLQALWPLLKSGGVLVYATCSVLPEENEAQIARFVNKNPDSVFIDKKPAFGRPTGHGWQIFPGEANMDGFFYSVLTKK